MSTFWGAVVGDQLDLDLWPRAFDLPPRWDGLPVEWEPWTTAATIVICPPPKNRATCRRCGTIDPPSMAIGRIWTDPARPGVTAISRGRLNHGRHFVGRLNATRCPRCKHDTVTDPQGNIWDLDPTDYTAEGSWNVG